ncbi:MAG TPA: hypothetical protein VI583_02830, partial [Cyclobacteriaceae bacterium]|nr:hypothetical protein [Cyclobacteriaceae bacterium]
VPYPACTGWLHRFIPGWTNSQLNESLKLVREFMQPNWDIHPEMISHTRVVDIKTGLPFPYATPEYMENWEWSQKKSADELGSYIAYALKILKEAGLNCEGMTTPGGFGSRNMDNLARGTLEAARDVYKTEVPHFFRDVITEPGLSVEPQLFHVSGIGNDDPRCSVHIIGCTDDWFGGWDGLTPGSADKFITKDLSGGRMVEVIDKNEPAIMVCHWPGIYFNGEKTGFSILKEVNARLLKKYNNLFWMKLSEIARYWAVKKLSSHEYTRSSVKINTPFSTKWFTFSVPGKAREIKLTNKTGTSKLEIVKDPLSLDSNRFAINKNETFLCIDLPRGQTLLEIH